MIPTLRSRTSSFSSPLSGGRPGHQQLVPGLHLRYRIPAAEPVGHHQAVEAPVVTQHAREERLALRRVGAVDLVVGGHDRPRPGLPHHDLEAPEVDLAQRPLRDLHVDDVAVPLVVVGDVVFRRRAHPLRLHALHDRRGHPARHERVLGEVLEVPPSERVAVGVEGRAEEHVDAVLPGLVPHGTADALDEVHVPGRGQERRDREGRAVVGARGVTLPAGLDPQAGRAVRHDDRGDPQPGDGDRRPRRAGDALRRLADDRPLPVRRSSGTPRAGADDEADLLFPRHRRDDVLRGALAELREEQLRQQLAQVDPPVDPGVAAAVHLELVLDLVLREHLAEVAGPGEREVLVTDADREEADRRVDLPRDG
jgi:hypothetical protein